MDYLNCTHFPTFPLIGRHARFSEAVRHMLATFPPILISFLSYTLSMITHNKCVIHSGTYRVDLHQAVMRLRNHVV